MSESTETKSGIKKGWGNEPCTRNEFVLIWSTGVLCIILMIALLPRF